MIGPSLPPSFTSTSQSKYSSAPKTIGPSLPSVPVSEEEIQNEQVQQPAQDMTCPCLPSKTYKASIGPARITRKERSSTSIIGPTLIPLSVPRSSAELEMDPYAPSNMASKSKRKIIGPQFPPPGSEEDVKESASSPRSPTEPNERIGPQMPVPETTSTLRKIIGPQFPPPDECKQQLESTIKTSALTWEQVRGEQKTKASEKHTDNGKDNQRDEWMTELPSLNIGPTQALFNSSNKFQQHGKLQISERDRQAWKQVSSHEQQQQQQQGAALNQSPKAADKKRNAEAEYNESAAKKKRDSEMAQALATYDEKRRGSKSLLELHREKMEKKEKKGKGPILSSWDRERDLVVNHKKKSVSEMNKSLGSISNRFGSGSGSSKKFL